MIETTENLLEVAEYALPSASVRTDLRQQPEPEPQVWRGIFSPVYKWEVLFSQQIKIRTSELPRLKPHVTVDRRMLEDDTSL